VGAHRGRLILAAAALLAFAVALREWLVTVGPLPGDRVAASWFSDGGPRRWLTGDLGGLVRFFDVLATPYVAAATVLILAAVAWEVAGPRWAALVVAAAGVVVLNAALKHVFGPTPLWTEHHFKGINLPSGHVAYVTALFGLVAWLALDRGRRAAAAACLLLVALIGPARIVAGTHLPSDVLAGYAVGLAWLALVLAVGAPWAARSD
jgi:membrane-associated phospholipid phosphatase